MNSLNASSANAISHWNLQKQLLLTKIEAKRSQNILGKPENIFDHLDTDSFYEAFSKNMEKSVNKFLLIINKIFTKIIF
jgi:hypothetical protein